jgi:hypothetical protein
MKDDIMTQEEKTLEQHEAEFYALFNKNVKKKQEAKEKSKPVARKSDTPRVKGEPKAETKQARVNALVREMFVSRDLSFPQKGVKVSKDFKQEVVKEIMDKVGMTAAGAQTYFYNALKTLK